MTVNTRSYTGIFLLVVGLLMVTDLIPASVVTYKLDTTAPTFSATDPGGALASPTPVDPYADYIVKARVSDSSFLPYDLTVTCTITWGITTDGPYTLTYTEDALGYYIDHRVLYTMPPPGYTIKFNFVVVDPASNTATNDAWAITGAPDGDFYLNGQKITNDVTMISNNPSLAFKVVLTLYTSLVTDISVTVKQGVTVLTDIRMASMTKNGDEYTSSYILPAEGTYLISAQIYGSSQWYTLAMIEVPYSVRTSGGGGGGGFGGGTGGTGGTGGAATTDLTQGAVATYRMFGLFVAAIGVVLLYSDKKRRIPV